MYSFELSDIIDTFIVKNKNKIYNFSNINTLSITSIEIQLRLHLPFYTQDEIINNKNLFEVIISKLKIYFKFYTCFNKMMNEKYKHLLDSKIKGKKNIYIQTQDDKRNDIFFKKIENHNIDKLFQEKLHYIKRYRKDTLDSFGLFSDDNAKYPLCYASVSLCDRKYLFNSLMNTNIISSEYSQKILVLTRAFSIDNAPKNIMSKLFDRIVKYYQKNGTYELIITALNPMLGFKGSIFKGSSYFQFAKSPMIYNYDHNGVYINRKSKFLSNVKSIVYSQKIETPSIVWLGRGINSFYQTKLEKNKLIYNIRRQEYDFG